MASMSRITAQLLQQLPGGSLDVRSDYHRVVIVIVIGIQDNQIFIEVFHTLLFRLPDFSINDNYFQPRLTPYQCYILIMMV